MNLISPSDAKTYCRRKQAQQRSRPVARKSRSTQGQQRPSVLREVALVLCRVTWRVVKELVIFLGLLAIHLAREAYEFTNAYRLPPTDAEYEAKPIPYTKVGGKTVLGRSVSMDDLADFERRDSDERHH